MAKMIRMNIIYFIMFGAGFLIREILHVLAGVINIENAEPGSTIIAAIIVIVLTIFAVSRYVRGY